MTKVFQTDWLASRPIFYNELTNKVSYNVNDVIDFNNLEFHPEGFNNYLDFGYSILEQTPIKNVKFLRHSSKLTVSDDGRVKIDYLDDPVEQWLGKVSCEEDVFQRLSSLVGDWEDTVKGEVVIPTSGGYDSRLLNYFIKDKKRIRSFTFGISKSQEDSSEVVYARKLSEILCTNWEQIPIGDFLLHLSEWDKLYGISTHAHGMYHLELYSKIRPKVQGGNPSLSGILGGECAGMIPSIPDIKSPSDVILLSYSQGLHADSSMSLLKGNGHLLERYYAEKKKKLELPVVREVETMRFKIILLSYLFITAEFYGFKPFAPFLCSELGLSMLTLPPERRKNRLWQKEFFQKHGIYMEDLGLKINKANQLDLNALCRHPLQPLDINLLREVIKPSYVEWINRNIKMSSNRLTRRLLYTRKIGEALRILGLKDKTLVAYNAYNTLKPIESLIKKRKFEKSRTQK